MKHDAPDWVMGLINWLPLMLVVGIGMYYLVRFKRGEGAKIAKARRFKKIALTFLVWMTVALALVMIFNLMQPTRH